MKREYFLKRVKTNDLLVEVIFLYGDLWRNEHKKEDMKPS